MQIVFTDGLGNEMFQYALYLAMRKRGLKPVVNISIINRNVIHNGFELCKDFAIDNTTLRIVDRGRFYAGLIIFIVRYLKSLLCFIEDENRFNIEVFNTKKTFIFGYWQNSRYFENISDEIRKSFVFRGIDEKNKNMGNEMAVNQSVSIHIRRGDYLKYPQYQVCSPDYYVKAISYIISHVKNPIFYVFSDDLEWSEGFMLEMGIEFVLIKHNRGIDSYKDMFLMSQCKYNIIANSSFSWWGAWLGEYSDKIVVSPSIWNKKNLNLNPQLDNWVKISV